MPCESSYLNSLSDYIEVNPNNKYTFSRQKSAASDGGHFRYAWYDENKVYISRAATGEKEYTVTPPSNAAYIRMSYPYDSYPKFERGVIATDWTPAPEDVQSDIESLETRIYNAETSISQNSTDISLRATKTEVSTAKNEAISAAASDATTKANNAVSSANTNTTNLLKNYSTTAQMNAAIDLKADSITSSVSSTYATKTQANSLEQTTTGLGNRLTTAENNITNTQDTVNNLNTVGSNLIIQKTFANENQRLTNNYNTTEYTYNESGYVITDKIYVNSGDKYTLSAQKNITGYFALGYFSENDIFLQRPIMYTTFEQTCTDTITIPSNVSYCRISFKKVDKDFIKFEKGDKVTDWILSAEDMISLKERVGTAESSITQLSNSITANVTETTNLGTRMSTVEQTASGLTASLATTNTNVTTAQNTANNAAKTATNYLSFSSSGLVIGDMTSSTLGENVLIDSNSVDIRNGTTTLASFGADTIYLGKNATTSVINLCNGSATMRAVEDSDFKIYTDRRLVMSAYRSMLLDCYRDTTHQTRLAIQSCDPDDTSFWGGIMLNIYQDTIKTSFDVSGNTAELKIENGSNTCRMAMDESVFKVYASNQVRLNSKSSVLIAESSTYKAGITLGAGFDRAKAINCYWCDNAVHDLLSNSSNGQSSYVGPGDIDKVTTTYLRGRDVRIYAHSGGGVYLGASGSTAITSDRNLKKDIVDIDDKYLDFFDRLKPITYKYNEGHRDHIGFIAQDVEEALIASGLTTEQFAGLIKQTDISINPDYDSSLTDEENNNNIKQYNTLYSLRYEEFISLLVKKVQDLQTKVNELERRII